MTRKQQTCVRNKLCPLFHMSAQDIYRNLNWRLKIKYCNYTRKCHILQNQDVSIIPRIHPKDPIGALGEYFFFIKSKRKSKRDIFAKTKTIF